MSRKAKHARKRSQPAEDHRPRELLSLAIKAHQGKNWAEAERLYRRVLAARPDDPDALHFFGLLHYHRGDTAAAIALMRRSLQIASGNSHALLNLGNVLMETEQTQQAKEAYERAAALAPHFADAWYNLGICERKLGDPSAAVGTLDRAISLRAEHAASYYQRGIARRESGDLQAAERDFSHALLLNPRYFEVYESLGVLLYRMGRTGDAGSLYRAWLDHEPDNAVAHHMAAAMSGQDIPARASDSYVTQTFDRFAATFDQNLEQLEYRAPGLVASALAEALGASTPCDALLDAGCGTGLCDDLLRPLARRLVGVDLSPKMVDMASAKGRYDEIHVQELSAFMEARPSAFDAIVAADTLVYFGALDQVAQSIERSLRPGGWLVLTLEKMGPGGPAGGYRIEPHGRYSHEVDYVRSAFAHQAVEIVKVAESILRRERNSDVIGLAVTARKTATRR